MSGAWLTLRREPLYWLLAFLPAAVALELAHAGPLWVFLASGAAIIPLAGLMGRATESLADTLGAGVGGLLNATFGNAAELIIALALLGRGPELYGLERTHTLVKASITGSIIGNVLLVLGLAITLGGVRHKRQVFNRTAAGMGSTLLALAAVGLVVPTLFHYLYRSGPEEQQTIESLSEEIAVILAVMYVLSLVFSLRTHRHLFGVPEDQERTAPEWGRRTALLVLLAATAGVAWMSELLVGTVEPAAAALGLRPVFVGVIVVAVIGNAAEHSTAVLMALRDKMDLAVHIAIGSSLQIALFVAPVLVLATLLLGHARPLDLHFTLMETAAVVLSVAVLALVSQDGETHWMEGAMLLGVYLILALAFYHLPEGAN